MPPSFFLRGRRLPTLGVSDGSSTALQQVHDAQTALPPRAQAEEHHSMPQVRDRQTAASGLWELRLLQLKGLPQDRNRGVLSATCGSPSTPWAGTTRRLKSCVAPSK